MRFIVYPAIDIQEGKCVRLVQGDYKKKTVYHSDPVHVAIQWAEAGAKWIHLVDLDAAKTGELTNLSLIEEIAHRVPAAIQVGGGIRNMERLERLLSIGVSRVIIGSSAVHNRPFVKQALNRYQKNIVISIDTKNGYVATDGWLKTSSLSAEELVGELASDGAEMFISTDISRDGMLQGINVQQLISIARSCGKKVIASGGVRSIHDIQKLLRCRCQNIEGVIVGKALYTGHISLEKALAIVGQSQRFWKKGEHSSL